jgi:hypothetical protein
MGIYVFVVLGMDPGYVGNHSTLSCTLSLGNTLKVDSTEISR